ncbi:uncharacterized, partial [Tachysurus ichikawai]
IEYIAPFWLTWEVERVKHVDQWGLAVKNPAHLVLQRARAQCHAPQLKSHTHMWHNGA